MSKAVHAKGNQADREKGEENMVKASSANGQVLALIPHGLSDLLC